MTAPTTVQGETLLLSTTRHLLALTTADALCQEGLEFLADALGADLAMLHVARQEDTFTLAAHVGEHPLLALHATQILIPRWRELLLAGSWQSQPLPNSNWDGPDEKNYVRFGAKHLVCFGLHSGSHLVGYVSLLFMNPRPDLDGMNILGTIGALWGTLLERMNAEATVRAREAMLRSITDNGTDIITILDARGTVLYQSASVAQVGGWSADEMLGKDVFQHLHPQDVQGVLEAFARVTATPGATEQVTYRSARRDGPHVWIESSARNLLHDPDVRGVVVHSRDVTAQQVTRRALEQRVQELTALHATSQALADTLTVDDVARTVIRLVKERLQHESVGLLRRRPDGYAEVVAYDDAFSPGGAPVPRPAPLPPGAGLIGACLTQDASVVVNDVQRDPRYVCHQPNVRSELVVPVRVNGRVWGALNIESCQPGVFNDEARQALETIAAQAGARLANVLLLEELQRSHEHLEGTYDKTIAGWARALDFRDRETEGHSQRVTELTVRLAREFGLSDEELVHVRRGALLHDIGKMSIPDAVLLKPGPLTDDEWAVMRRHPDLAVDLLSPIAFLAPALDIPHAHHEKWDGSGYPRGLRGDEIPLAARIFAVVDVWDALCSDRPYRAAWPAEKARAFIAEQAGRHFDPDVVQAFLALLDERARALGEA